MFTLQVAADGDDGNDGVAAPVATLARARDILAAAAPDDDVEIRIGPGIYHEPPLVWNYFHPERRTTFMPAGFVFGQPAPYLPVFDGQGSDGWWLRAQLPADHPGATTRLRFYFIKVTNYANGLEFRGWQTVVDGYKQPASSGFNGNTVYGCRFENIGGAHSAGTGYAGVQLYNSSGNTVANNHFRYLENTVSPWLIHGLYIAHYACGNEIRDNSFYRISASPVRVRNAANDNDIHHNRFELCAEAAYSEWFCDQMCVGGDPSLGREAVSGGNLFHHNELVSHYNGGPLREWELATPGPRVTVYDNV